MLANTGGTSEQVAGISPEHSERAEHPGRRDTQADEHQGVVRSQSSAGISQGRETRAADEIPAALAGTVQAAPTENHSYPTTGIRQH